ncbi:MAG: hypothetical protein JO247_14450, partial [Chloroflexi bacterium]|nr:hypothetical protein [Chloroflexota bacterium]
MAELALTVATLGAHVEPWRAAAGAAGAGLLAACLLSAAARRSALWGAMVLCGLRLLLWLAAAPSGWLLNQNIDAGGQTAASQTTATSISFSAEQAPAHLINSSNLDFFESSQPKRETLPVAFTARTYVQGSGTLALASSAPAKVTLGDQVLFDSQAQAVPLPSGEIQTPKGPRTYDQMRAELKAAGYSGAQDDATIAYVYQQTVQAGGCQLPINSPSQQKLTVSVAAQNVATAALTLRLEGVGWSADPSAAPQKALGRLVPWVDWALLAVAAWTLLGLIRVAWRTARRGARVTYAIASLLGLISLAPHFFDWLAQHGQLQILSGGNDWLDYEGLSRGIRDGSWLMLQGAPLGHAAPIFAQALYPYFLALEHVVAGETVQSVLLLHLLATAVVVALVAAAILRRPMGLPGLVLVLATGVIASWFDLAGYLLSENLLLLLFAGMLFYIGRFEECLSRRHVAVAGVFMGLAILTRTTPWLAVPFLVVIVCRAADRRAWRPNAVAFLLPVLLLAALIPARNLIATGTPTPLPTAGGLNFSAGIVPPGRTITTEPWLSLSQTHD